MICKTRGCLEQAHLEWPESRYCIAHRPKIHLDRGRGRSTGLRAIVTIMGGMVFLVVILGYACDVTVPTASAPFKITSDCRYFQIECAKHRPLSECKVDARELKVCE